MSDTFNTSIPPPPDPPKNLAEAPQVFVETVGWVINGGKVKALSTLDTIKDTHDVVRDTVNGTINSLFGTHIGEPSSTSQQLTKSVVHGPLYEAFRKNRFSLGLGVATVLGTYTAYKAYRLMNPYVRRATKLSSGQRFEVILVMGSPLSRVVKKLINDLNTRGYIVFVTVTNEAELKAVEIEKDDDVRPLIIDYESRSTITSSIMKLANFLDSPFDEDDPTYYHFKGCIFVPDYLKLPKIAKLSELEAREFTRVSEDQLFRFNDLLQSGLLTLLKESNERKDSVQELNEVKFTGGYAKLLFVNFVPICKTDGRTLMLDTVVDMNKRLFNQCYRENQTSILNKVKKFFDKDIEIDGVDAAMLTIKLHRDDESRLLEGSFWKDGFNSLQSKKLSSRTIHYKVFDLLNANFFLKKEYVLGSWF